MASEDDRLIGLQASGLAEFLKPERTYCSHINSFPSRTVPHDRPKPRPCLERRLPPGLHKLRGIGDQRPSQALPFFGAAECC